MPSSSFFCNNKAFSFDRLAIVVLNFYAYFCCYSDFYEFYANNLAFKIIYAYFS